MPVRPPHPSHVPSLAEMFKSQCKESYDDPAKFFKIAEVLDRKSIVRKNEAGNAEIVFSDGSTYIIGLES